MAFPASISGIAAGFRDAPSRVVFDLVIVVVVLVLVVLVVVRGKDNRG